MKRIVIIIVLLIAIPALRAQKKELKKAQQDIRARNFESANFNLNEVKRFFAAADDKTRAEYYVVLAELKVAERKLDVQQLEEISQALNLASRYELNPSLQQRISQIKLKIDGSSATIAASELKNKNYSNAASLYKIAYQSAKDTIHLLKASRCYLLAKEYDDAYNSYRNLITIGYTNAKTKYVATNLKTNKKGTFPSASERNKAIAKGLYKNPEIITTHSKLPEILRGLTVSSIPIDKKYEAVAIIDRVLAKMPENKTLMNQVSFLYIKLDAIDKYNAIVDQQIKENSNDANLYYNSAVVSAKNKDFDRASNFYKKTLKIDPNFINAKINLSTLLLDQDKALTTEMNKLEASSETDGIRYRELKQKRKNIYQEAIPYIESVVKAQPQNEEFSKKLRDIQSFLNEDTKVAILEED